MSVRRRRNRRKRVGVFFVFTVTLLLSLGLGAFGEEPRRIFTPVSPTWRIRTR